MATKLEGGGGRGGKALVAGPLKTELYLRLPLGLYQTGLNYGHMILLFLSKEENMYSIHIYIK